MTDTIINAITIALVLGQIVASIWGRRIGICYYFVVCGISYFSFWMFGTWTLDRLCGSVYIVAELFRSRFRPGMIRGHIPFWLLSLYGIVSTLLFMIVWPTGWVSSRSAVYSQLRGVIQIANWIVMMGMAWHISKALTVDKTWRTLRKWTAVASLVFCCYAFYQVIAYSFQLPMTGIRRPVLDGFIVDDKEDENAAFEYAGQMFYRPGSLIGEPKVLGGMCVLWSVIAVAGYFGGPAEVLRLPSLIVSLAALMLTSSTSAIGGALLALCVLVAFSLLRKHASMRSRVFLATGVAMLAIFVFIALNPVAAGTLEGILRVRTVNRLANGGALGDKAEMLSMEVLKAHPEFAVTGVGLGGMSFYIAEMAGGTNLILSPNNGLLAWICDVGLLGFGAVVVMALRALRGVGGQSEARQRAFAFIGLSMLLQCFVFSQPFLMSMALGFLGAAYEIHRTGRRAQRRVHVTGRDPVVGRLAQPGAVVVNSRGV
mgnify:CR=1 FL=1